MNKYSINTWLCLLSTSAIGLFTIRVNNRIHCRYTWHRSIQQYNQRVMFLSHIIPRLPNSSKYLVTVFTFCKHVLNLFWYFKLKIHIGDLIINDMWIISNTNFILKVKLKVLFGQYHLFSSKYQILKNVVNSKLYSTSAELLRFVFERSSKTLKLDPPNWNENSFDRCARRCWGGIYKDSDDQVSQNKR